MSRHFLNFLATVAAITLATGAHAMRLLKLLLVLCVCAAGPAVAGPYEDAFAASKRATTRQRCVCCVRLLNRAMPAPSHLGFMYDKGQGVPQDYAAAVSWYRKAAEQGDADAQFNLGFMYDQRPGRAAGLCGGGVVVSQSCRPGRCRRPTQPRLMYATAGRAAGLRSGSVVVSKSCRAG